MATEIETLAVQYETTRGAAMRIKVPAERAYYRALLAIIESMPEVIAQARAARYDDRDGETILWDATLERLPETIRARIHAEYVATEVDGREPSLDDHFAAVRMLCRELVQGTEGGLVDFARRA